MSNGTGRVSPMCDRGEHERCDGCDGCGCHVKVLKRNPCACSCECSAVVEKPGEMCFLCMIGSHRNKEGKRS